MRGFSFKVSSSSGKLLDDILKPVNITEFDWYIGYDECYIGNDSLFPPDVNEIDGTILKELLNKEEYLVIFADLKAYPKGKIVSDIDSYEEFLKSDCQLVLLISDCFYCEIYCKDRAKLERMFQHAKRCAFENVEYITDENDGRTRLSVW